MVAHLARLLFSLRARVRNSAGFGLIDIVVSMFLLALLAVAFLPALLQSAEASAVNTTMARANQLVASEMENLRNLGSQCAPVREFAAAARSAVDVNGTSLRSALDEITCPTEPGPTTIPVRVFVTDTATGELLVEATTLLFVLVEA